MGNQGHCAGVATLCAHPQFREFDARLGAIPNAFKSGPGGVAKFLRSQFRKKGFYAIICSAVDDFGAFSYWAKCRAVLSISEIVH